MKVTEKKEFNRGHQDGWEAGALTLWGKAEGAGLVQPGAERASGGPNSSPPSAYGEVTKEAGI